MNMKLQIVPPPARQRGVALITAIFVVTLAVMASVAMVTASNIAVHRATSLQETETAWWYATGVESWIRTILQRDAEDNQSDSLADEWARPLDYLPLDQGFITGRVVDAQGLFNLNNLGNPQPAKRREYDQQFERLLANIGGIDPFAAQALLPAIHDWIDTDSETTPYDGAEDNEYARLTPPYRNGNQAFRNVTELMAVKGMNREIFARLYPYVTALPVVDATVNANTAPAEVLNALSPSPGAELQEFIEKRTTQPAESAAELPGELAGEASVTSEFFELRATVTIGNSRVAIYSLYNRALQSAPVVLARSIGTP
jgi:general secretion pathway protein K